jgi:hypothetical protein
MMMLRLQAGNNSYVNIALGHAPPGCWLLRLLYRNHTGDMLSLCALKMFAQEHCYFGPNGCNLYLSVQRYSPV